MSHPNPSFDSDNSREDDAYYNNVREPFETRQQFEAEEAHQANSN